MYRLRIKSIKKRNHELEILVLNRTHEINGQKEELLSQKEELLTQKDKIQQQNQSLELAYNDVSTLSKIGKKITSILDASKLNAALYESVNKLMKADGFGVGVYNKKTNSLDFENYIENGETLPFLAEKIDEIDSFAIRCFTLSIALSRAIGSTSSIVSANSLKFGNVNCSALKAADISDVNISSNT